MSGYEALLAIHILTAALWVGGGFAFNLLLERAHRSRNPELMLATTREHGYIGPRFYLPNSIVVLVSGILLVGEAGYDFSDTFVSVGLAGWIASFLIGAAYFSRVDRQIEAIIAEGGRETAALPRKLRENALVGWFDLAIIITVLVVMAVKP